jgi:hypothetical protein
MKGTIGSLITICLWESAGVPEGSSGVPSKWLVPVGAGSEPGSTGAESGSDTNHEGQFHGGLEAC